MFVYYARKRGGVFLSRQIPEVSRRGRRRRHHLEKNFSSVAELAAKAIEVLDDQVMKLTEEAAFSCAVAWSNGLSTRESQWTVRRKQKDAPRGPEAPANRVMNLHSVSTLLLWPRMFLDQMVFAGDVYANKVGTFGVSIL